MGRKRGRKDGLMLGVSKLDLLQVEKEGAELDSLP